MQENKNYNEIMNSTIDNPPEIEKIVWTAFSVAEIPFFYIRSHILNLLGKIKMEPARYKLQEELRVILDSASDIHFTEDPKQSDRTQYKTEWISVAGDELSDVITTPRSPTSFPKTRFRTVNA